MRGTTKKLITEWATKSWNATSDNDKSGFKDLSAYIEKIKSAWKADKQFQKFIHSTMKHFE